MAYPEEIKNKVRSLRAEGKTYSEINKITRYNITKGTLSNWCRNIKMPTWYERKILKLSRENIVAAQRKAWKVLRSKRAGLLSELKEVNKPLAKKLNDRGVLKLILAALYLGEGSKWKSHRGLVLGSSDQNIIKLYLRLLELCYGLLPRQLKCRISHRADQNIKLLERYWSKITSIPAKNFYKTIPDPRTVGKPTKKIDYKGVCVIIGGSTKIQLELEMIPEIVLQGLW